MLQVLPHSPGSQTPFGNALRETPFRVPSRPLASTPIGDHVHQSRQPRIVARAGIAPMHRVINIASFDWVIVDVLQFLEHHVIALDLLRHAPFRPNLIIALRLVSPLQRPKLAE